MGRRSNGCLAVSQRDFKEACCDFCVVRNRNGKAVAEDLSIHASYLDCGHTSVGRSNVLCGLNGAILLRGSSCGICRAFFARSQIDREGKFTGLAIRGRSEADVADRAGNSILEQCADLCFDGCLCSLFIRNALEGLGEVSIIQHGLCRFDCSLICFKSTRSAAYLDRVRHGCTCLRGNSERPCHALVSTVEVAHRCFRVAGCNINDGKGRNRLKITFPIYGVIQLHRDDIAFQCAGLTVNEYRCNAHVIRKCRDGGDRTGLTGQDAGIHCVAFADGQHDSKREAAICAALTN